MVNKLIKIKQEAENIQRKKQEETEATRAKIADAKAKATEAEQALNFALTEEEYIKAEADLKNYNRQIAINSELLRRQGSALDLPADKYNEYLEELLKQHTKSKSDAQKIIRGLAIDLYEVIEAYTTESEELLSVLKVLDQAAGRTNNTAAPSLFSYLEELRKDADGASSSILESAVRFYNSQPIPERMTPPPTVQKEPAKRRVIVNDEIMLISAEEYNREFLKRCKETESNYASNVHYF